jgi:hypothetical protein
MKLSSWDPDIRSIVARIDGADVDLQPDFQRQEVWPLAKKKRLIDTILREWSIPPVHFVVTADNRLEVLDGQQRLASIRDFLHDQFAIDANISPFDETLQPLHGRFYSQLDQATRRKIDNYPLRGFRITEYQPEEPNELFYRLNQPTSLTAGEQRNALFGPAREQLKRLVDVFQQSNSKDTIGFSNARMAYDDIIAKFLYFVEHRNFGIRASESLISERFKEKRGFDADVIRRAEVAIEGFSKSHANFFARFNKANVLSWLLFFSRFPAPVNLPFVTEFSSEKFQKSTRIIGEAYSLFENRASLRVADVASVVYRDFCLWYGFVLSGGTPPPEIPSNQIADIGSAHSSRDDVTLEVILAELLDVSSSSTAISSRLVCWLSAPRRCGTFTTAAERAR